MLAQSLNEINVLTVPVDELVTIATAIVKETVRLHGDARAAIEPYTNTVKNLVAKQLTHSEQKAAGLIPDDETDAIEVLLRAASVKRERSFERRNAQTSRRGWRPRGTSSKKLAEDIAHSIKTNAGRGIGDYTSDPELAIMVQKALGGSYAQD